MKFELFDSLMEPVFILSNKGQIRYCNDKAAALCGFTVRRILRQQAFLGDVISFEDPPSWIQNLHEVKESTPYQELTMTNMMGDHGRVQVSIQWLEQHEELGPLWLLYVRDVRLEESLQGKYRDELEQKEGFIFELQRAQTKLINYSKNLESMVEERTYEIKELNLQMKALLDSLSEGFLIFTETGKCLSVFSQACLTTLEKSPLHLMIWEVLNLNAAETENFKKWMSALFGQMLPFEDLKPLGPNQYVHSQGRTISLDYFPLMNSTSSMQTQLTGVVLVATDISELVEAQKRTEIEKKSAQFILALVQKQDEIARFLSEAQKLLANIHEVEASQSWQENQEGLLRWVHTLKGGSGSFTYSDLAQQCHEAENLLVNLNTANPPTHLQLSAAMKSIHKAVESFIKEARQILGPNAFSPEKFVPVRMADLQLWADQFSLWSKGQATANAIYSKYIFFPMEGLLRPYQHLLEKIAVSQNKLVAPLSIDTQNLCVSEERMSSLFASLVHVFRNIIDHGIESPEERIKNNKSPEGHIQIEAKLQSSKSGTQMLLLCISDDGRGVDPEKVRKKMKSLNVDCTKEDDNQVIQRIFDSQVSTKEVITELSGRGVGLEAVKFEVTRLGGKAWVTSKLGEGTKFWIELPWLGESNAQMKSVA